jgi:hypothetical protein
LKVEVTLTEREARALKAVIERVNFLNVRALKREDIGLEAAYGMHTKIVRALKRAGAGEG